MSISRRKRFGRGRRASVFIHKVEGPTISLAEVIVSESAREFDYPIVDLPLTATSPEAIVKFLVGVLVQTGRIRPEQAAIVIRQVLERESLGSTGVGRGVAMPHAQSDCVGEILGIIGRAAKSVAWPDAIDRMPVRLVGMLITPHHESQESLAALEAMAQRIRNM